MRRPVLIALAAVIAVLVGTTAILFVKYQKTSADYTNMKAAEETARNRYAQTIDAIAEIQDSLSAISLGDTNVNIRSGDLQTEQRMTGPDSQEALDRIALLRSSILRSKARILQLESSLKSSGMKVAGLQKMLGNLKRTVTEKEQLVADLSSRVDTLQTQVAGLETEVQQSQDTLMVRNQVIEDKRRELATIYYAVGSKKELASRGVIVAKGGVLGLGKTLQPSGLSSEAAFTPLDTDQETVVAISSSKAKVVSAQPPSSYELRLVGRTMELRIVDPREFRKIKQLVIVTA